MNRAASFAQLGGGLCRTGGAGNWGTQARPSGAPTQAAGQEAEAMPIRPGDAQAAERARTGGEDSPVTRSTDLDPTGEKRLRFTRGVWKFQLQERFQRNSF
jgi:hypothetical protein